MCSAASEAAHIRSGSTRRAAALAALCIAAAPLAGAQNAAPSTQELIEQLQPAPATRSFGARRSFKVVPAELAPSAAASASDATTPPAPRPSVSLSIEFDFDSAQVRADSLPVLRNLAQALQSPALLPARFIVEGHTDASGRASYNLRLSAQRAEAVRDWLAGQGVARERLSAVGKGATEPALPAQPDAAANRRVRIVNLD